MTEKIEIAFSKTKLIRLVIVSLLFVGCGIWFLLFPPQSDNFIISDPFFIRFIGLIAVLFFGITAVILIKKSMDNKPGLIIDEKGITDNSSGLSAGFVPWEDIKGVATTQTMSQKFILILLYEPRQLLQKQSGVRKKLMEINLKNFGSPFSISPNALNTDFKTLLDLLQENFERYKG